MKLIGFLKCHDRNVSEGEEINDIINSGSYNEQELDNIIDYLRQGVLVFAWMKMTEEF